MTRQTPHAHATRCTRSDFNLFLLCTTFAELPQICSKTACCLRDFRKYVTKLYIVCGTPVNITQNCILLAESPQTYYKTAWCLRNSRKHITKLHDDCGSSASIMQKCASFAEVPQMMRKTKRCSSQSAQIPRAIVLHHRHNNLL